MFPNSLKSVIMSIDKVQHMSLSHTTCISRSSEVGRTKICTTLPVSYPAARTPPTTSPEATTRSVRRSWTLCLTGSGRKWRMRAARKVSSSSTASEGGRALGSPHCCRRDSAWSIPGNPSWTSPCTPHPPPPRPWWSLTTQC